jgi:hypothetical protein
LIFFSIYYVLTTPNAIRCRLATGASEKIQMSALLGTYKTTLELSGDFMDVQ